MPLDVQRELLRRVVQLVLTHPPVLASGVRPGNVHTANDRRMAETLAFKDFPAAFPQVVIYLDTDSANDRPMMVMDDDPESMDLPVPMTLRANIDVNHDSTVSDMQTRVEAAVKAAVMSKGRTLGLLDALGQKWISNTVWQPVSRRDESGPNSTSRTRAKARLVAAAAPLRSQLIAIT